MIGAVWLLLVDAATAEPTRDAVMTLLNAYETPVDAAAVEHLGNGSGKVLVAISNDVSVPPTRRARAIAALQHVPHTSDVVRTLRRHLTGSEPLLQRHAALALSVLGNDAVGDLVPALASTDSELRVAAATALGKIGSMQARAALKERLDTESEAAVRTAITAALEAK